ncbi:carbohydrate ABC transporter permease [Phytohabitans suffuscus]|uniref:Sugar ABC transporter permease n=1 Tax=Phytohabitans suffuscus TaxID=624315 RepID=A0A6F8YYS1_9ACTN|nr:carbohydrate ABC transporter permease [Phytohabitans suffuscus]BCB91330.1 sugar ABC transporter permease [Phytohabitans suffuscus]
MTMRRVFSRLGLAVGVLALLAWLLLPLLVTLSVSLKTRGDVFATPGLIPEHPTLDAYGRVLQRPGFRTALLNSALIGLGTCALTLLIGVPAAYAFARFRFRGRHLLLLLMLLPRLVPSVGVMLPLYRLAAEAGAIDKRLTLVVVYSGMLLPLAVWLMVGFFQAIPQEIEEAANVDGASMFQRLRMIVLPLTVPALVTIAVLAFREAWNEFQLVLVLTTSADKRTLPYELYATQGLGLADLPMESAFALLTIVPLVLVYVRLERYVVQGMVSGAVK